MDKLNKMDDNNGEINPYHEIITNKVEKDDTIISQMEQWLILSNIVHYVQYDSHLKNYYDLNIKAIDSKVIRKYIIKKRKDRCEDWILIILQKIKRRIFRHVQRHSVRSNKYY